LRHEAICDRTDYLRRTAGEPSEALTFYEYAEREARTSNVAVNRAIALRHLAVVHSHLGNLDEAAARLNEALEIVKASRRRFVTATCLAELGCIHGLRGQISQALEAFNLAAQLKGSASDDFALASTWEIKHAAFLIRIGARLDARKILEATFRASSRRRWKHDSASCQLLFAQLDFFDNRPRHALSHLVSAEAVLRQGHILLELALALLMKARVQLITNAASEAFRCADEALTIAAPRQLQLMHGEALIVRGKIRLHMATRSPSAAQGELYAALDDAESGLDICSRCDYKWAETEAHTVLRDIWKALGNQDKEKNHGAIAAAMLSNLKPKS